MNIVEWIKPSLRTIFTIDLRSLALFRIGIATMLLLDFYYRIRNVEMLFTDSGFLPRQGIVEAYGPSMSWTSLHYYTGGSIALQSSMLVIAAMAAVALLVGYRTWWATLICWGLFVSINRRIPAMCYGFDDVMRLLLLWSLFLPIGARWSLDSRRSNARLFSSNRFCSVASAGILLQVCYIYWFTFLWKMHPDWLHGRAIQYAMELDYAIRPLGKSLAEIKTATIIATYATLAIELLMPFVALSPVNNASARWCAILTMWGMHLSILACISIGLFPAVAITYWILFIPTSTWDALARRWSRSQAPVDVNESPLNARSPLAWQASRVADVIAMLLLVQISVYNIFGLPKMRKLGQLPKAFTRATELMRVDQQWSLYAPTPNVLDGWYVMPAILMDGSTVDIWMNQPVTYAKPSLVSATFPDFRATMFLTNSRTNRDSPIWPWVARYIVRRWNAGRPSHQQVKRLQIIFVGEQEHAGPTFLTAMVEYDAERNTVVSLSPSPIGLQ